MRPLLFEAFGIEFYSFGFLLGWSIALCAYLTIHLATKEGVPKGRLYAFVVLCILAGIVGGRVQELLANAAYSGRELAALAEIKHSGRGAYGAMFGGVLAGALIARPLRVSFWVMGDTIAPSFGLGQALGRIGCFLAGCDYGIVAHGWLAAFAVRFPGPRPEWPAGSPAWQAHVARGWIPQAATESLPVVPAQLISSLKGWVCFAVCLALWRRRPRRAGDAFLAFFLLYGMLRALVEQIRDDPGRGMLLGVSTSTGLGLMTASAAVLLLFVPPLARLRPMAPEPGSPHGSSTSSKSRRRG